MAKTKHEFHFTNAQNMGFLDNNSIQLIVTSPPYPMIQMWDDLFSKQNKEIENALKNTNGNLAFELIHKELDQVWEECFRVLQPGGFACINIGDATRTIGNRFKLYSNHFRILKRCHDIGFDTLPNILWRKQTNAPNKFMGSGMLPSGAYVTLEHEYILILRKGTKREFKTPLEKENRQGSAFFWEERNLWFSDIWDFKGVKQQVNNGKTRKRSAAYPFELAYRLINMYSAKGDTVLDPFLGTGTTTIAAIASERNSIGLELDQNFESEIDSSIFESCSVINQYILNRLDKHRQVIEEYLSKGKILKYINECHNFPVMTKQETNLKIDTVKEITKGTGDLIFASYSENLSLDTFFRNTQAKDNSVNT